jgi:hypothetical protein
VDVRASSAKSLLVILDLAICASAPIVAGSAQNLARADASARQAS